MAYAACHPHSKPGFTGTRVDTHQLTLFLRYQTTYERAFYKALNTLTNLKLSRAREQAVSSRRKSDREFVSQGSVIAAAASPWGTQANRVGAVACPARRTESGKIGG
ncbi:MAG TPA: hypothetical protein VH601_01540 [Bryobacteraceae bacterium]